MKYRVVKIINEYLLVVNYGYKDKAYVGDKLEVYEVGEEVIDPKTNKSLGTLDLSKGKVVVENVYENMSLCKSTGTQTIVSPGILSFTKTLANLSESTYRKELKPLNVNASQISGGYNDENLVINLNDPVRLIESEEYDLNPYEYEENEEKNEEAESI